MNAFGKSQSIRRIEDLRFLTGHGAYVDDIAPADALHAFFLRSQVAHGELRRVDLSAAREAPGVHLVMTADDIEAAGVILDFESSTLKDEGGTRPWCRPTTRRSHCPARQRSGPWCC